MTKSVAIIANGTLTHPTLIKELLKKYDLIFAADGGANHCFRMNIIPNLIIGDLDSISSESSNAFSQVPSKHFPKDKDETDLELAIKEAFDLNADKITIFAGIGNRIDHTLVNLHLLRRYPGKLFIESEDEIAFVINKSQDIPCHIDQPISLLPIGEPITEISSKGLKWELHHATFDKNFFSISNVCQTSPVSISLKGGDILCCLQKIYREN